MSGHALGWAFGRADLGPTRRYVLVALADAANDDGICWPSQPTLAAKTGLSERAVRGHLAVLEEEGYLRRIERRRENGSRRSDLAQLPLAARQSGAPDQPAGDAACEAPHPAGDAALEPPGGEAATAASLSGTEDDGSAGVDPPTREGSGERPAGAREGEAHEGEAAQDREDERLAAEREALSEAQAKLDVEREVDRLCDLMAKRVNERTERAKPYTVTKAWRTEMRRLIEIDGRSPVEIEAAIEWVHKHHFWAANILSVQKLRKQYDTIRLQARREKAGGRGARTTDKVKAMRDKAKQLREDGR